MAQPASERTAQQIVRAFRSAEQDFPEESRTNAYRAEQVLMECVRSGNETQLEEYLQHFGQSPVRIGHMSNNALRQARYTLVSGITLLTRHAMEGGLPESEAYLLSDQYLCRADEAETPEAVYALLVNALSDFTHRVRAVRTRRICSYPVTRCIHYIADNLHNRITLEDLAALCHLTPQYLSALFRRETGQPPIAYIRRERLETAARMLLQSDYPVHQIANFLAYAGAAAFSADFKKQYGVTPTVYRATRRGGEGHAPK